MTNNAAQLVSDTRDAIQGLRGTLIELFSAVGADPDAPQDVSRQFGINRNLTWKLSRVMSSHEPFSALNYLPGGQGLDLALRAFRNAGAPDQPIARVADAMRRLTEVIEKHADDRDHLELALESMGLFQRESRPEGGLELAYRGNSMVWGLHARARISTAFLAPGVAGPHTADYAQVASLIGFRRLRPTARWRLYRMQLHDDKGGDLPGVPRPIGSRREGDPPMIVREFCSENMPTIESQPGREGVEYILPAGPVGNTAAFDCVTGYSMRGLPLCRDERNEYGSTAVSNTFPVETLIFDLLVHQALPMPPEPEVIVYGFPHGGMESPAEQVVQNVLPIAAPIAELAGRPPVVAMPLFPRYSQLVAFVFERMGWTPAQFRGWRVQIGFPPMSSRVVLRWPLPERPA